MIFDWCLDGFFFLSFLFFYFLILIKYRMGFLIFFIPFLHWQRSNSCFFRKIDSTFKMSHLIMKNQGMTRNQNDVRSQHPTIGIMRIYKPSFIFDNQDPLFFRRGRTISLGPPSLFNFWPRQTFDSQGPSSFRWDRIVPWVSRSRRLSISVRIFGLIPDPCIQEQIKIFRQHSSRQSKEESTDAHPGVSNCVIRRLYSIISIKSSWLKRKHNQFYRMIHIIIKKYGRLHARNKSLINNK